MQPDGDLQCLSSGNKTRRCFNMNFLIVDGFYKMLRLKLTVLHEMYKTSLLSELQNENKAVKDARQ